jgi:hypothetical protein
MADFKSDGSGVYLESQSVTTTRMIKNAVFEDGVMISGEVIEYPTQLDRIEAKLDELISLLKSQER